MLRAVSLVLLAACNGSPLELSVDVRTDLAPGTDFDGVLVELEPGQGAAFEPITTPVDAGDPTDSGMRVADFSFVPEGPSRVRATLLDGATPVLARAVDVTIESDFALTIVITSDCVGVSCPGATEPGSYTECLHGRCIDPRCGGSSPSGCGELACTSASDCDGVLGECVSSCVGGACVCTAPPPPMRDAGPPIGEDAGRDAGPCPGECAPGETSEETQACGQCNEGVQRRTRTCGDDCRWGELGAFGNCETGATCTPGQTDREQDACGNCNLGSRSRTRTCNGTTCTWDAFGAWSSCSGGGECAAGDTRAGGCDGCSHQVCSGSCNWGGCTLRPGNQCEWRSGTHFRCCGTDRWEYCLSSCQWSGNCAVCSCGAC